MKINSCTSYCVMFSCRREMMQHTYFYFICIIPHYNNNYTNVNYNNKASYWCFYLYCIYSFLCYYSLFTRRRGGYTSGNSNTHIFRSYKKDFIFFIHFVYNVYFSLTFLYYIYHLHFYWFTTFIVYGIIR